MTTKTDIGTIKLVEIPQALKERNREKQEGRALTTGYRLVVSFSSNELSDKENELLSKLPEQQREMVKKTMLANRTDVRYSGVFNAEDIYVKENGEPFVTPDNGLSDAAQDDLCNRIAKIYADMGNVNIFTVVTYTIKELLDGTEHEGVDYLWYDGSNGHTKITDQSRLFFGFFSDLDAAKSMIRKSLLNRIENDDLELPEQTEKQETPQTNKLASVL